MNPQVMVQYLIHDIYLFCAAAHILHDTPEHHHFLVLIDLYLNLLQYTVSLSRGF